VFAAAERPSTIIGTLARPGASETGSVMTIPTYVIRGGLEGRERLRVLARVMWPTTERLFAEVGIPPTARCLDLGCGGGDVTVAPAQLALEGYAVGTDLDKTKVELARREAERAGTDNIEFRVDDVMTPPVDADEYDVVYARFLLTHLTDPAKALEHITSRLAPGGVLIVEDMTSRATSATRTTTRSGSTSSGTARPCKHAVPIPTSGRASRACCSTPASSTSECTSSSPLASPVT